MADITEKIDIEEIMSDIRKEIAEKGYDSSMLSFDDVALNSGLVDKSLDFDESLKFVRLNYEVEAYRQLPGNKVSVFIKKVLRKLMKFYIEPLVRDQNQLNLRYSVMFSEMEKRNDRLTCQIDTLLSRIDSLTRENEELEKRLKDEKK